MWLWSWPSRSNLLSRIRFLLLTSERRKEHKMIRHDMNFKKSLWSEGQCHIRAYNFPLFYFCKDVAMTVTFKLKKLTFMNKVSASADLIKVLVFWRSMSYKSAQFPAFLFPRSKIHKNLFALESQGQGHIRMRNLWLISFFEVKSRGIIWKN